MPRYEFHFLFFRLIPANYSRSNLQDTLKVSGAQVSPVEIEDCLLSHPERLITDATVAGVSGGRTSDEKVPRAWVVLSATGKDKKTWRKEAVVKELERWHQENLSKYKWLRGGIEIVDEAGGIHSIDCRFTDRVICLIRSPSRPLGRRSVVYLWISTRPR